LRAFQGFGAFEQVAHALGGVWELHGFARQAGVEARLADVDADVDCFGLVHCGVFFSLLSGRKCCNLFLTDADSKTHSTVRDSQQGRGGLC